MFANTNQEYPISLLKATGIKSFETLGKTIGKSGKTISRSLLSVDTIFPMLTKLSQNIFQRQQELILAIDDTLIKKKYSKCMQGSGPFYDMKISRRVTGFKVQCAAVTDGKSIMPIDASYLFSSDTPHPNAPSKLELFRAMTLNAITKFSTKKIIVAADGLFSTTHILRWCLKQNIATEMRMHSNRVIEYEGKEIKIKNLQNVQPKGRHKARTVTVKWHDMTLFLTGQKRRDQHGNETIVYLVSTFKAKPSKHVATYQKRWGIEKMFRTTKQHLGLKDCYSTNLSTQFNHLASVFLAYAFAQIEQKKYKVENSETAIRWFKAHSLEDMRY